MSLSTTCDTCIVSVRSLRRRRSWAFLRQLHPQEYWLSSLALSICRVVVVHPTFFRFPAPIEPDLVGHDRENELVRFVIQDIFLSLTSFTLFIEGFLKIRTTVTVFFTNYSLKTIFLKHGQIDCKYLSHDLSGLMSLQNNILSRF